ncbi:MAG: 4Fe-4S dicluster domain-containing protein [Mangrovibacterium sp.]
MGNCKISLSSLFACFDENIECKFQCVDVCPVGVIEKNNAGGIKITNDECICCGACIPECPKEALIWYQA